MFAMTANTFSKLNVLIRNGLFQVSHLLLIKKHLMVCCLILYLINLTWSTSILILFTEIEMIII